jgi:hypothetical protein
VSDTPEPRKLPYFLEIAPPGARRWWEMDFEDRTAALTVWAGGTFEAFAAHYEVPDTPENRADFESVKRWLARQDAADH